MSTANTAASRIRSGGMSQKAVDLGLATDADFEQMARDWEAWAEKEESIYASMHGEILVRK